MKEDISTRSEYHVDAVRRMTYMVEGIQAEYDFDNVDMLGLLEICKSMILSGNYVSYQEEEDDDECET